MQDLNKQIRNILTLRYDPGESPALPKKNWTDWLPTQSDPDGQSTEKRLLRNLDVLQNYSKIAIALSSGVDSSLVLALIRKKFPNMEIHAIHYTGTNNNELEETKKLANRFKCQLHLVSLDSVFPHIQKMIEMLGAPKWDAYDFIIYEEAKKHADILVTGDGSDELYAGYTFRYKQFEEICGKASFDHINIHIDETISGYLACHRNDFVSDQEKVFYDNLNFFKEIHPFLFASFDNALKPLAKVMMADYNGKLLHNFLIKKDAFAEAFSLVVFSPFLNQNIRDYATHIPIYEKYKNGIGKLPLRSIAARYGLHPPIKKLGFTHNILEDWQKNGSQIKEKLQDPSLLIYKRRIINLQWVLENINKTEERIINKLVSIYTTELFLKWMM